jgi:dephospho-CoA kinase
LENPHKPFVIGLVGNLGSGKSLVRKMLERLGGLGIDADLVSHRILLKTSPAHRQVVDAFGIEILNEKGEIDRKKLAVLVFSNPERLSQLEKLVHPAVEDACKKIIADSTAPFVVIEAIKLLESGLVQECDSIWAVNVPPEIQIERVMRTRGMTRDQALQRIQHQSHPNEKAGFAQVIIENSGGVDSTWKQVTDAMSALQLSHERFARFMSDYEQWKNQHRFVRLLQPTNYILTKKLISAALPIEWINRWIGSAMHQFAEQVEMVTRSNYFEMLVNFQGVLVQPDKNPELLSLIKIENFILQPLYLFKLNPQKEINVQVWLNTLQLLADQFLCEAIVLPINKKYDTKSALLVNEGYMTLAVEDSLYDFWKSEVSRTRLTGYNVMAKRLRNLFIFN